VALALAALLATALGALLTRETLFLRALGDIIAASVGLLAYLFFSARLGLAAASAPLGALRQVRLAFQARVGLRS
jgi:hypothetical protein